MVVIAQFDWLVDILKSMNDYNFCEMSGEPDIQDKQTMVDGMLEYHASHGHPRKTEQYSVTIKDSNQKLIGCAIVSFLWNGMAIQSLWVDKTCRGQGLGKKLMEMVEAAGVKRGCTIAYTDTFTWQAPGFYEKIGYTLYGKLDDFPVGNALSYYCKNLS